MKLSCIHFVALTLILIITGRVHAAEMEPFYSRNQNPFVQIYGLPVVEPGFITPHGQLRITAFADVSNNFSGTNTPTESIWLDGETSRFTALLRYGLSEDLEAGIDIPLMRHNGGFTDGLISNFHNLFNFLPVGRDLAARNQLNYSCSVNGTNRVNIRQSNIRLGDILLSGAYQLWRAQDSQSLALRIGLKLPTGSSGKLNGSGGTDLSFRLAYSGPEMFASQNISAFASLGILALGNGKVMQDVQRHVVGFGSLGLGWKVWERISLKIQIDGHTPFYNSSLDELGMVSAQLIMGGSIDLFEKTSLDLAVSEDIIVDTAPDVVFHLALRTVF
jgi:hypothetical protein